MVMDELYSLNVSRFIGKDENAEDLEEEEANRKYQELLMQEITGMKRESSDEEDQTEWN